MGVRSPSPQATFHYLPGCSTGKLVRKQSSWHLNCYSRAGIANSSLSHWTTVPTQSNLTSTSKYIIYIYHKVKLNLTLCCFPKCYKNVEGIKVQWKLRDLKVLLKLLPLLHPLRSASEDFCKVCIYLEDREIEFLKKRYLVNWKLVLPSLIIKNLFLKSSIICNDK